MVENYTKEKQQKSHLSQSLILFLRYKARQWYYENILRTSLCFQHEALLFSAIEEQVEKKNAVPKDLYKKCGDAGILPTVLGMYPWPVQ